MEQIETHMNQSTENLQKSQNPSCWVVTKTKKPPKT